MARLRQTATPWGAAIASTLDRWSDSAVLAGRGWYYRDTWGLAPVLRSMIGTAVVPYVRARGEGLGVLVNDGMMQRKVDQAQRVFGDGPLQRRHAT